MKNQSISIIIPVRDEYDNLVPLFFRLDQALKSVGIEYEAIVVDDYSTDGSFELLKQLEQTYPIKTHKKQGKMVHGLC